MPHKPFQSFPETGSDEISSHMNWEVAMCIMGFLSQLDTRGGWERESREVGHGEVPTLPLMLFLVLLIVSSRISSPDNQSLLLTVMVPMANI